MVNEKDEFVSTEHIEKRLSEMLREDMAKVPEAHISLEELYALAEEDKIKRRKRFIKYASAAAVFILICSVVLFVAWPGGAVPADADKSSKTQVDKDGNAVVINEENMEGEKGNSTVVEDDWDNIYKLKSKVNNLYLPEYYPAEFRFQQLTVDIDNKDSYKAEYYFEGKSNSILQIKQSIIEDAGNNTVYVNDDSKIIDTSKGKVVFYMDDELTSKATIAINNNVIIITAKNCNLPANEYKNIIESLKIMN